jgi:hypothetical protein
METVELRRTLLAFPASNNEGRLAFRGTCHTIETRVRHVLWIDLGVYVQSP